MKIKLKIISYLEIEYFKSHWINKKTVLVGGCFDLFHYGHLQFLKKASQEGDFLLIALESDEFIKKNKRNIPIHNQKQRAEILSHLDFVDIVILLPYFNNNKKYFEMVKKINPKIIAVTENDPQIDNKKDQIKKIGGKLKVVVPLFEEFSTTKILNKLNL